jgi:hypothetical protein
VNSTAVGDFNRDGKLDLAVVDYLSNNGVTIFLGNGDGTFRRGASYITGVQPLFLAAADFRNNGIFDLVVGDSLREDVYVLLGNGDGTFQDAVPYPTTGNPFMVSTGDFTGDGKLDIIAITKLSQTCDCIEVLPGNGDGTFASAVLTPVPYNISPFAFAAGHFDSDSKLDLAVAGAFGSANQVDVLLGNGDGTFRPNGFYDVASEPGSVAVADFNGDKKTDLAVANELGNSISILLGNGDGTFQPAVDYPTKSAPTWIVALDLNGDGKVDLAASSVAQPAGVSTLMGNGDGTFEPYVFYPAGSEDDYIAAGDFNGDHQPDLIVADFIDDEVITLLNTGNVKFTPTTPIAFPFQLFNTTSKPQTVKLTNTGTTALSISSMKATGQFGMTSTCGTSVAAGASCNINVTFSPKSKGMKSGLITINDSASSKPQVIELSGQGTVVELSPASLDFGSQKVGTKSNPQTITVTNQGTTALSIAQISVGGTNAKDFTETNDCPASLGAGANCAITVTFDPSKTGTRKASVSISDNGGGSPQTVPLTGTGT